VSLSLRDELRVVIYRDQIQLVRIGRQLTLRGRQSRILEKKIFPFAIAEGAYSDAAIQALESALSGLEKKPAFASVILSNHFMNYAMVELNQSLNSEAEEQAYAKHCFVQLFGTGAESWEIRLNRDDSGARKLASALDAAFLQNLRAAFARAGINLKSIQPCLMAAFNNSHSELQNQDAWFVLFENASLCVGLVKQGSLGSIRTMSVDKDWLEKLTEILDRESYLSDCDIASDKILLWAPEYVKTDMPKTARWKIQKVKPEIRASFAPDFDERFALALCN
jgi:hypothetical protein